MNELFKRLSAETPKFFKRLQKFGLSLVPMGAALLAIPKASAFIQTVGQNAIVAGLVIAAVAQCAVNNTSDIEKPADEKPVV